MAECVLGTPIFAGKGMIEQLSEIMKVIGTPTRTEIMAMNRNYNGFKVRPMPRTHFAHFPSLVLTRLLCNYSCDQIPQVSRLNWRKVFRPDQRGEQVMELVALVQPFLQYTPSERPTAAAGLKHAFFLPLLRVRTELLLCAGTPFTNNNLFSCSVLRFSMYPLTGRREVPRWQAGAKFWPVNRPW